MGGGLERHAMKLALNLAALCLLAGTAAHAQQSSVLAKHARHAAAVPARHRTPKPQVAATAATTTAAPNAIHDGPFPDVPKNHWAYQSVETLRKAGVMRGYPSGTAPAK